MQKGFYCQEKSAVSVILHTWCSSSEVAGTIGDIIVTLTEQTPLSLHILTYDWIFLSTVN